MRTLWCLWGFSLVLVIASGCGNDGEPSGEPGQAIESGAASTSVVSPEEGDSTPPGPAALPEAAAPHGLAEIDLPDTEDGIVAVFDRLPADLIGRQRTDEPPGMVYGKITASYGSSEPVGCAVVGLQAMNVSTGEFFPEGWTAEMVIEIFATGKGVEEFGRDGQLVWAAFTTTCGEEGSSEGGVVSTLSWGVTGSEWVFSASAGAAESRDELTLALVTAVG